MTRNGALLDPFRHNAWANRVLLDYCRDLSPAQLAGTSPGAYADIVETFNHILMAEARYAFRLTGTALPWSAATGSDPGDVDRSSLAIADLLPRADEIAELWERFLAGPVDPEQVILLDDGAYQTFAGVLIAQALHHGSAHREQICASLTAMGLQPPDMQPWAYADATGRGRETTAG